MTWRVSISELFVKAKMFHNLKLSLILFKQNIVEKYYKVDTMWFALVIF